MTTPRCRKPAGRAMAFPEAVGCAAAVELREVGGPPFLDQKYHAPRRSTAAIAVGQIQKGNFDPSSTGGAAVRVTGRPGSGVAGPDRVGAAPVARAGCAA